MSKEKIIICKVSKGKSQNRVTLPRVLNADYVAVKKVELNIFDSKRRYYK